MASEKNSFSKKKIKKERRERKRKNLKVRVQLPGEMSKNAEQASRQTPRHTHAHVACSESLTHECIFL